MTNSPEGCSAESAVEHLQARGRHYDIIREAIAAYDEYMLDDDYDAQRTLDSIIKRMRERTALTDAPVIQSEKVTEQQIEDGAKALFGEGWDKTATPANRRYCREKAKAIFAAMAAQPTDKIQSTTPAQPAGEPGEEDVAIALFVARHHGLTNIMPWDDIDHDGRDYWRTIARNLMRTHRVVPVSHSSAANEGEYWRDQLNGCWDRSKADALKRAAEKALNYIENTENELGIKLSCGDALREVLK